MSGTLRVLPLGGVGEIGKNMTVVEYDGRIVVVDTGLRFPTAEQMGIDLVLPDFTYLRERVDDIEAIVITHGHEDHLGALPWLLRELAELENVVAVKQARYEELVPIEGLTTLAGNDDMLADVLDMGGAGGICVASHIVGPDMRRMYDEPAARAEIDASLRDVYETMFITASPTPVKAALNLLGHDAGTLRLPMVEADEAETAAVRAMLERHGLLSTAAHA